MTAVRQLLQLHTSGVGEYDYVFSASISVTVTDDDTPKLIISQEKVSLSEDPDDDMPNLYTYTVKLATQPSGNVRVDVTSNDPKIATVSPESLTFTPVNSGSEYGTWSEDGYRYQRARYGGQ